MDTSDYRLLATLAARIAKAICVIVAVIFVFQILFAVWSAGRAWTPIDASEPGVKHPALYTELDYLVIKGEDAAKEDGVIIGRDALGQRGGADSADIQHIALKKDANENWSIANVSQRRRLEVTPAGSPPKYTQRISLTGSGQFYLGAARVKFADLPAPKIGKMFAVDQVDSQLQSVTYELVQSPDRSVKLTHLGDGSQAAACQVLTGMDRFTEQFRRILKPLAEGARRFIESTTKDTQSVEESVVLYLGGAAYCPGSLGVTPNLPIDGAGYEAIAIIDNGGALVLAPGRSVSIGLTRDDGNGSSEVFTDRFIPLASKEADGALIAGRTKYSASVKGQNLIISPTSKSHRFRPILASKNRLGTVLPPEGCFNAQGTSNSDCGLKGDGYESFWTRLTDSPPAQGTQRDGQLRQVGTWLLVALKFGLFSVGVFATVKLADYYGEAPFSLAVRKVRANKANSSNSRPAPGKRDWRSLSPISAMSVAARLLGATLALSGFWTLRTSGLDSELSHSLLLICFTVSWVGASISWLSGSALGLRAISLVFIVGLVSIGAATQVHMSAFATTAAYDGYAQNTVFALAGIAAAIAVSHLIPLGWFAILPRRPWLLFWLIGLAMFLVVLLNASLHASGGEEGFGGMQPTEINKIVLVILLGLIGTMLMELWMEHRHLSITRDLGGVAWQATIWFILLAVIASIFVIPVAGSDMSPSLVNLLVLVGFLLTGCAILAVISPWTLSKSVLFAVAIPLLALAIGSWSFMIIASTVFLAALLWDLSNRDDAYVPRVRWWRHLVGPLASRTPLKGVWGSALSLGNSVRHNLVGIAAIALPIGVVGLLWAFSVFNAMTDIDGASKAYEREPAMFRTVFERILSFHDLSLTKLEQGGTPSPSLRALNFQVVRSREALALAPCGPRDAAALLQADKLYPNDAFQQPKDAVSLNNIQADLRRGLCSIFNIEPTTFDAEDDTNTSTQGNPFAIPAVHDDFAGAYAVAVFGVDIALLSIAAQTGLFGIAFLCGLRLLLQRSPILTDRRLRRFFGLASLGVATLLSAQFLFSWGNIFGLLPVMGQPMTFVSAGMSHILAVGGGSILILSVVIRLLEAGPVRIVREWEDDISF